VVGLRVVGLADGRAVAHGPASVGPVPPCRFARAGPSHKNAEVAERLV